MAAARLFAGWTPAGTPTRRTDVNPVRRRGSHSDGLVGRRGDGAYGLGGMTLPPARHKSLYVIAEAQQFRLSSSAGPAAEPCKSLPANGAPVERLATDGEMSAATITQAEPGTHKLEAESSTRPCACLDGSPEKAGGVTVSRWG